MKHPDLAYLPINTCHIRRNIRAKVIGYPKWMSEQLRDAIVSILEQHARTVTGLVSGFTVFNTTTKIEKELPFSSVNFYVPELSGCEISETMNAWVDGAIEAIDLAPETGKGDVEVGLSIAFYEMNATHTTPVRSWLLREVFPTDTGLMSAVLDLDNDRQRDEVLEDFGEVLCFNFSFDKKGSAYNTEAVKALTQELVNNFDSSQYPGYAEPMVPGSTYVFTVDEHDPDPKATVEYLQKEFMKAGNNLVLLSPEVKQILDSEDFDISLLRPYNMAEQKVNSEPAHNAQNADVAHLKAREAWFRNNRDAAVYNEYIGFKNQLPFTNYVADLHTRLDGYGIPSSHALNAPSTVPRSVFNGIEDTSVEHTASIEIPHSLQEKKVGNELPEGWKDPTTPNS